MEKTLSKTGIAGEFTGIIRISPNYTTKLKDVNNPVWHDTESRRIPLHKVEAFFLSKDKDFDGSDYPKTTLWKSYDQIETLNALEDMAWSLENMLSDELERRANHIKVKTFEERMAEKGFK
jgi:hypothetical protein